MAVISIETPPFSNCNVSVTPINSCIPRFYLFFSWNINGKKHMYHNDVFFFYFLSLNFRFKPMITGCLLVVLFHCLISLNCQWSVTFIACNYGNAIPLTLTLYKKKKVNLYDTFNPSSKLRVQLRQCLARSGQIGSRLVIADIQYKGKSDNRKHATSKNSSSPLRRDAIRLDSSPPGSWSETLKIIY